MVFGMIGVVASGFAGVLTGLGWYTGTHRERYIREYQIERQDLCESTLTDAERERARSIRSALEKINKQHSSHPVWQGLYQVFSYGLAIFSTTCYTVLGCYTAAETLKKKSLHGISTVLRFASQAADMMGSKLTRNIGVVAEMLPKMERDIDIKMKLFPSHRLTKYIFQYETICQESLTRVPLKALETLEARLRYHPSETLGSTRLSALCDQVGVAEGDVVGRYLAEQLSANNRWINPERIAALTKHLSHRDRLVAESRDPSPAPSHD